MKKYISIVIASSLLLSISAIAFGQTVTPHSDVVSPSVGAQYNAATDSDVSVSVSTRHWVTVDAVAFQNYSFKCRLAYGVTGASGNGEIFKSSESCTSTMYYIPDGITGRTATGQTSVTTMPMGFGAAGSGLWGHNFSTYGEG